MKHVVTALMALAILALIGFSFAPTLGFAELKGTQYISQGLGLTGLLLLAIAAIGGWTYWKGRQK